MATSTAIPSGNTSVQCETEPISGSAQSIAIALSHGVLVPIIVLGNGLVVIAFITNRRLRSATNIFICGLGLSDLLIGTFSLPYWTYISSFDSLMNAYCTPLYNVYICIDIGTGCASILQLTSIAIERLYFTVVPMKHRLMSRSVYWYMVAVAWFFSIFVAALQPLQIQFDLIKEYSVFLLITCFVFPLLIIVTVYLYILKVVRSHARSKPSSRTRMGTTGGNLRELNVFITVIVITGVFVIAWTPFFVVTVVSSLCATCITRQTGGHLVRFVKWMQYSSSAINPYIYAYRNNDVKRSFKKILRFCMPCASKDELRPSSNRKPSVALNELGRNDLDQNGNSGNLNYASNHELPRVLGRIENATEQHGSTLTVPHLRAHQSKESIGSCQNIGFVGAQSERRNTQFSMDKISGTHLSRERQGRYDDLRSQSVSRITEKTKRTHTSTKQTRGGRSRGRTRSNNVDQNYRISTRNDSMMTYV